MAAVAAAGTPVTWNRAELEKTPQTFASGRPEKDGVKSLFYEGVPYEGKATRVFAYLAVPKRLPPLGEVLVRPWLRRDFRWDTCGCVSGNEFGDEQGGHRRHDWAGPQGWGDFKNVGRPVADQWPYHAVAAVVRANSLLRSLPEVDPERIGLTGVSWGGYLTCMAASVDPRFAFAAPVYGCGFLDDNSVWKDKNGENGSTAAEFAKWCGLFDPRHYLAGAKCDFLWIDGSNDFAYPLDSLQKSVESLNGVCWYRATRLNMPHGHGPYAEHPQELVDFAAFKLRPEGGGAGVVSVHARLPRVGGRGVGDLHDGKCVSGELFERTGEEAAALRRRRAAFAKDGRFQADFSRKARDVRPALHSSGWSPRLYPRKLVNDDAAIKALRMTYTRTHDWALVNSGQRLVDTWPRLPADASRPEGPERTTCSAPPTRR
ncbi:unnamed protein product [Cylicocyclus nassatus]|uniref:Peptidase S9 prolyl oligopeptidase catalytic domain-containing protein n=1 Tax=Cylicocyclus nassatus TaxID=53992 RepID=A0AA36GQT7_CYLNA|nr:unnamed protein product [Cylicocyclus nassatus]